jgi:hypothetical protein
VGWFLSWKQSELSIKNMENKTSKKVEKSGIIKKNQDNKTTTDPQKREVVYVTEKENDTRTN